MKTPDPGPFRIFLISMIVTVLIGLVLGAYIYFHAVQIRNDAEEAAKNLKRPDISITFPEGKRREEMAALLQAKGICPAADFLIASKGKEGYLFPDTYRFFPETPAADVVDTLQKNFVAKTASLNPSPSDIILASIIEREAKRDADRPAIASIYLNRLNAGMKLESDPTVQYSKDTLAYAATATPLSYVFWKPITQAEYQSVQSPYNTYLSIGLPPGPLDNPGLKSIQAAIHPAHTSYYYLYYDKAGTFLPSKTFQEHLNNQ